ncbi:MAG: heavy-metal-associated domain-containing protein [Firmicutes bacterium]|nr:heavy-metal-associated domain-containing protein [Bacillota bacterium]
MKKVIKIRGMHCQHCQSRVEQALNDLEGVTAKVNLKKEEAVVTLSSSLDEQILKDAIQEVGYEVLSIKDKKGLFS